MRDGAFPLRTPRVFLIISSTIIITTMFNMFITTPIFSSQHVRSRKEYLSHLSTASILKNSRFARRSLKTWVRHLLQRDGRVNSRRIGCREFPDGAQTCVFEGLICINTSTRLPFGTPKVYLIDDDLDDGAEVPSDHWCSYRHQSSDPKYWGGRHWPIWTHTVAPRWSCMKAFYRTRKSLGLHRRHGIKWVESLWLIHLDYVQNDHNNHLFMDIVWLLDAMLWDKSLGLVDQQGTHAHKANHLFGEGPTTLYLPQGRHDFEIQGGRDLNRLIYALVLQLNLSRLYSENGEISQHRTTQPLFEAYPDLNRRLMFHRDLHNNSRIDMVCTSRLTAGAKLSTGGHERVCRSIRERTWALYRIPELPLVRVGQVYYAQPPKRIVIVQRHVNRKIRNVGELEEVLKKRFLRKRGFEVEVITTDRIQTAEDWVRLYSRAGVLISSHGSQNMAQMFMPRHSALVEVMPVGYTDNAFNVLSVNCRISYYQLQSMRNPDFSEGYYMNKCGDKTPHLLNPCNEMKNNDVQVDIEQAVKTVGLALERIGYVTKPWMEFVQRG